MWLLRCKRMHRFLGFYEGKKNILYLSNNLNKPISFINVMVKREVDDKICRDCGNRIIGRRINAIVCKECRMRARKESSQRKKDSDKREKILKKVKEIGLKFEIEYDKKQEILKNLKEELEKNSNEKELTERDHLLSTFNVELTERPHSFYLPWESKSKFIELQPFLDLIDEKVREAKENARFEKEGEINLDNLSDISRLINPLR